MNNWIPFEKGTYLAEQAFLVTENNTSAALERTFIEIYTGRGGQLRLKGTGLVRNIFLVRLLDENDDLDLILDFGEEFKYRLKTPVINAGKVFSPDVKSHLQFVPDTPWTQITVSDFDTLLAQLKFLEPDKQ
jgi:hypothetical protein